MSCWNVKNWPVMQAQCPTCPFRTDARGRHADPELVGRIQTQILTEASQICHHPSLSGQRETHLCRGARDFQLMIFHRLGVLKAPTDQCWQATRLAFDKGSCMH